MARTTLAVTNALGPYGDYSVANSADVTMTAADVANMNQFLANTKAVVFAHNTGASAYTITVTSTADRFGRTKDISAYSLGAGEYAVFGPWHDLEGWGQSDGYVYLQANNAAVKFGVIILPH